jgi:hypothetical protein
MAFLTVNNNLSLISITIAPTTFLYSVGLLFIFLSFYISPSLAIWFRRLPASVNTIYQKTGAALAAGSGPGSALATSRRTSKALPAPPSSAHSQLVLQDQSLVFSNQEVLDRLLRERVARLADYRGLPSSEVEPQLSTVQIESTIHSQDGRSSGRSRRIATGLRTPRKPKPHASSPLDLDRTQRSRGSSRGLRASVREWLLPASMEKARKRRPEQRLLEGSS